MKRIAIALALASMTAVAGAQTAKTHKLTGWIGDSKCGASMHTAQCVKSCVQSGQKPVFVDAKNKVWAIDNTDAVKEYYGDKVKVVATVDASGNSIHVDSVKKAGGSSAM
ncbi:MAG TPA: DegT/DnrJ/EryC1/StrS family aminotransferase [Acidobacteriaceae bacterium]|nr:DegT/DnrJ/EryC1/StrS family aminotransferase [Acidobacteriaceae bacterium]